MLYVIRQLPDRRPIFIPTLRAAHLLVGPLRRIAHRSGKCRTTAGILPLTASPGRSSTHPPKIRTSVSISVIKLVHKG